MNNYEINYNINTYQTYKAWQYKILHNNILSNYGLTHNCLGYSKYNYPIDLYRIGHGKLDIFIVSTTHGSEIISLDFAMHIINNIDKLTNYSPNDYTLNIIPLLNPEGFDITSTTYKDIVMPSLEETSHNYYERYKIDNLINKILNELENIFKNQYIDPKDLLNKIKYLFNNLPALDILSKYIYEINILKKNINEIGTVEDYLKLKKAILYAVKKTLNNNITPYYKHFADELLKGFDDNFIWKRPINKERKKLHQEMFRQFELTGLSNKQLENKINDMYKQISFNTHLGSTITYDATGSGINLNANNIYNPGIDYMKENIEIYGPTPRDNILKYVDGPIGLPCIDPNSFKYSEENKYLLNIINNSFKEGKYLCTLLYHGTGGMIYYEPSPIKMEDSLYNEYLSSNKILAELYANKTNYRLIQSSSLTGTGDYLRMTYPQVLLIELSQMGGNPIGPYGDINNFKRTITTNLEALNDIFEHYNRHKSIYKYERRKTNG